MDTATPYRKTYVAGLILCACSLLIYLGGSHTSDSFDIFSLTFFINYGISIFYLVALLFVKLKYDHPRPGIAYECWINVVILLTISAFSLNRQMNVFSKFPDWLNIYTVASIPLFLLFPYYKHFPGFLKALILLLAGGSFVLSAYMFFFLLPLIPLSCVAFLFFGISIHSFVPTLWLLVLFDFIFRRTDESRRLYLILAGACVPIGFLGFYLFKWQALQTEIKDRVAEQNIKLHNQLPDAIYLAQKLPEDALTDEILVSSYRAQRFWGSGFGLNINEGASKYHNPLSIIGNAMFGDINLDRETVEKLLNIRKDYRHNTAQKLWTGMSLSTSAVSTNIKIFPQYRLAYHEKTIMIHNNPDKENRDSWFTTPTQEAAYTFHLPEGSIVTSLSLWINGQERQSRLTTMQRADSAYTTIVGRERRDPAVVHWREGNKVRVTIFPCTPEQDRKFKIGFTCPLKVTENELCLENVWFEGPETRHAREATQLIFDEGHALPVKTNEFEAQANGNYLRSGDYLARWQLRFSKPALSAEAFCFEGFSYALKEANLQKNQVVVKDVFLDVSKEWTREEYDAILKTVNQKKVYTWVPEKTEITATNKDLIWKNISKNQFSFPFLYDIAEPEHSVIITKTTDKSPVLEDLKGSDVAQRFMSYLADAKTGLNVINIGTELSPFWRSLRELRLIHYEACTTPEAISKIQSGELAFYKEDTSKIAISDSHLSILKTPVDSTAKGRAPDHLLRVFAYNDLLRKMGSHYFEKEKYENDFFREAEEGYVVSPVTSLIVLESEEDYARMGIGKNKHTVGNATVEGGGAVPEPHEWLLIGLVAFFIIRHLLQQRKTARA